MIQLNTEMEKITSINIGGLTMQNNFCKYLMLTGALLLCAPKTDCMQSFWNLIKNRDTGALVREKEEIQSYESSSSDTEDSSGVDEEGNFTDSIGASSSDWEDESEDDSDDLEIDPNYSYFDVIKIKQPIWNPSPNDQVDIDPNSIYTFRLIASDENGNEKEFIIDERLLRYSDYLNTMMESGMWESQQKTINLKHLHNGLLYQMWEIACVYRLLSAADILANAVAAGNNKGDLINQILEPISLMPTGNQQYIVNLVEELQIESLNFISEVLTLNTLQTSEGILSLRNENILAYILEVINNIDEDNNGNFIETLINSNMEFFYSILPSYERKQYQGNHNFYDPEIDRPNEHIVPQNARSKVVKLYNTKTKMQFRELRHDAEVFNSFFDQSGTKFITAAKDAKARIWDVKSGELLKSYDIAQYPAAFQPKFIAVSPCGRILALIVTAANNKRVIRLYNIDSGLKIKTISSPIAYNNVEFLETEQDHLIMGKKALNYTSWESRSYKLPHFDKSNLSHLVYLLLLKELQNNNDQLECSDILTDIHISLPDDLKTKVNTHFEKILYQIINNLKG